MGRAKSATAADRVQAREREVKALELRKAGASYQQIGDQIGVSKQACHKMVTRVLGELVALAAESAEEVRRLEIDRMDAMMVGLWDKARRGHEGAVDRVLRIMTRRAALLGLDMPTRSEIAHTANVAPTDLSKLTDEELEQYQALMKKAAE